MLRVHPVILCGGSGTRLWPLSRTGHAKQFLKLFSSESLLQLAARRIKHAKFEPATFVGAVADQFLLLDHLAEVAIEPRRIILEPSARNTAAAVALAALDIADSDPFAVMLVMPSDHLIGSEAEFLVAAEAAAAIADNGRIVTFGIEPTAPETGFGYIVAGEPLPVDGAGYHVGRFVEKPVQAVAEAMLACGDCYWNAGIFMMRSDIILTELAQHAPDILEAATAAHVAGTRNGIVTSPAPKEYARIPNISIDYAVMERTEKAAVVPVRNIGWSDVGSFAAVWESGAKDERGNVTVAPHVLAWDSDDCLIMSDRGIVATAGVRDLIIVQTQDALLVTTRDCAQDVKKLVAALARQGRDEVLKPSLIGPSWGSHHSILPGDEFQAKHIVVKPGQQLSEQSYIDRVRNWVIVRGTALVTCNEEVRLLHENQSICIPRGASHRLENPGNVDLELIEVQGASCLGEVDIARTAEDCAWIPSPQPAVALAPV